MEQVPCNEQLASALSQVEELQRELSNEREEKAVRVTALEETIHTLQEDTLAEEKKGVGEGVGLGICVVCLQLILACVSGFY